MNEKILLKGNEAIAIAAVRCGCDGYFGYPITPQSEILETLSAMNPEKETGMIVLQAESEVAAINMLYGGAGCGKKVMTSSSSPGISLMTEGISYIAGAELPCVIVDIMRGGPGLGTIQPAQSDYFQITKGGGHGDYHTIILAPASVQEMNDFVDLSFELAFRYRTPVVILSDGVIGQMMEKVELSPVKPRWTDEEIVKLHGDWASTGKTPDRQRNIVTSLDLDPHRQELFNTKLQNKYREIERNEIRYEALLCDDAEYLLIAYGLSARVCQKAMELARDEAGIKVGLIRPVTLFPYPYELIERLVPQMKGILTVEMSAGQMVEDVSLAVRGKTPLYFHGRTGGMLPSPEDIFAVMKSIAAGNYNPDNFAGHNRLWLR
ncbi:MAG: 3-methyl-2-oxobutanoate dehydrogenase subunit VorB [Prevotellaceae bacterium]|jgi:2-oxoglutarate ferredoxin oxidoreductase subunit alpha|nr:3-methyl-2-oxobutanoate dehydrogenase subunit VorB [Prevotellaceae bacterium]